MDRYERILTLHRMLKSAHYPIPLPRLLGELECSRATLYRDVAFLRDALGAPIESAGGESAAFRYALGEGERFELPGLWLTSDELAALLALNELMGRSGPGVLAGALAPFKARIALQQSLLQLPLLPTTGIGSLPQTREIRELRAAFRKGAVDRASYEAQLEARTADAMRWQDEIGIDVPVHGEYERNDMVEYFGEQLKGFAFTERAWVQSYGSRCVKPPIIYGDVSRPAPMTLRWTQMAQKYTAKPVKGMLTGPVTVLQWSFVRDDQPRRDTCFQIALAIRDEVLDLEKAGVKIIQIDEAALREGLPIRKAEWAAYLDWAVQAFRLTAGGVAPSTQIHTHMCYSEFNDIIGAVAAMDADVISIETSRSAMELLDAFAGFQYPNDIGPGVYDIHSPRVPGQQEMEALLEKALKVLKPEQLWVNPDCGLKTRGWAEVKPALIAMVAAAKAVRARLAANTIRRET